MSKTVAKIDNALLVALADPPALVAVTTQVMLCPASALTKVYVFALVPILAAPRFHW